jgi:HAD superfamily hydrolase (TIGR01484 family)
MKPLAEWPLAQRRLVRGVLSDIDDTLTTYGRLEPEVLAALQALREAGLKVVAVTGRPTYWAMPLLRLCGFDAVIAENGASAFWLDGKGMLQSWFYADAPTRSAHRSSLETLAAELRVRYPQVPVAEDAAMRVGDLAFDIGENVRPLPAEAVDELLEWIRSRGYFAAASSIHAHASLVQFSKQTAAERMLREVFHVDDDTARASWVFIGDSGNDASMFAHYPMSVGVANVAGHLAKLEVPPAYVTQASYGAGFVEFAGVLTAAPARPAHMS